MYSTFEATESATEQLVPLTERPTSKVLANHSEQTLGEQPLNPTDHHHNHFEERPKPRTTDSSYIISEGQQSSKTKQHTPPGDKAARTTKAEPTPLNNFTSNRDQPIRPDSSANANEHNQPRYLFHTLRTRGNKPDMNDSSSV